MTELQARELFVKTAAAWLGATQGSAKHAEILSIFNSHLPRRYKMQPSDPWCATFASIPGILLGWTDILPVECSCNEMIRLYKNHPKSQWEERDDHRPKVGDIMMYGWKDSATDYATTDFTGTADHVGIVYAVSGDAIDVLEGNYSKSVKIRRMKWNGQYIRGYCLPAFHLKATVTNATVTSATVTQQAQPLSDEERIWAFLTAQGLNDYAAAGIMGNLYAESGLKPNNLENSYEKKLGHTDASYTKAVDDGTYAKDQFVGDKAGYGLAQWTYHTRKQALYEYTKTTGRSIADLSMQLEFMWREMQGYAKMMAAQKSAKSVREASNAMLLEYERPAGMNEQATQDKRAGYGQKYYDKYAGKTIVPEKPKEDDSMVDQALFNQMFRNAMLEYQKEQAKQAPADWSEKAREWAESEGVKLILGVSDEEDKQYKTYCTREMLVTVLLRFYEYMND